MTLTEQLTRQTTPARQRRQRQTATAAGQNVAGETTSGANVGDTERLVSVAAGAILALEGAGRRDALGALIAGVGGVLIYRGATGRCPLYNALELNTSDGETNARRRAKRGLHVTESFLINKTPEELYSHWQKLENLPSIMSHLEEVRVIGDRRSHWVAKAPAIAGGRVEWDAETTLDEPGSRIAWRSLPGSEVENRGEVRFTRAPGDRGTMLQVDMEYLPPAGRLGHYVAKLFGEAADQQIREDLRKFKRIMEVGEAPTITGQPRGTCLGRGIRQP